MCMCTLWCLTYQLNFGSGHSKYGMCGVGVGVGVQVDMVFGIRWTKGNVNVYVCKCAFVYLVVLFFFRRK